VFEVISTITDILIAIIGLVIAIYGFRNERRAKREEYVKNVTLKEVVSKMEQVSLSSDYLKSVDKLPVWSEDDIYSTSALYIDFINKYNDFYSPIIEFYKGLLKFESEFSLSYGFERYILYFREYIRRTKNLDDRIQVHFLYLQEDMNSKDYNGCIVDCGHLHEIINKQVPAIKSLDPFIIKELRYKFSIES